MEEEKNAREPSVIFTPATQRVVPMNKQMFATIIAMIPAGKLTTLEAIYRMWAKRKGGGTCELQGGILPLGKDFYWQPTDVQRIDFLNELSEYRRAKPEDLIPYWRIISLRGNLIDFGVYCTKETQREFLEREGHVIIQPDPNKRLYKVQDYKAALFDLDKLIINE